MSTRLKFNDLADPTWNELLADDLGGYSPPLTVHLPIQPLHSPDFIHVDAGLNACRRRVYPNISTNDLSYQKAKEQETFIVQLALDDPPFIPDFRLSKMRLAEGKYPVAEADYFAWDIHYQFEYYCRAIDEKQNLLRIHGTVSNEKETPQAAHVRVKVNFQRECDLFDYHYVPFYWDNTKWLKCAAVNLKESWILKENTVIGKISDNGFSYSWEKESVFANAEYNKRFGCGNPYFVTPAMRLNIIQDVIHFQDDLKPAESKTFSIVLLTNYEDIQPEHIAELNRANYCEDRDRAIAQFKNNFGDRQAALVFPGDKWGDVFTELQLSTLQLLVRFPGRNDLMPNQGGSTERFFVWVWEAVFMLLPMLRLGHFLPVRKVLDFIFALQDAGCPPEGEFTTTAGSIGTAGPKWINSTGSALALAADYYLYSRDEEFLKTYLPKIIKAAGWIVGEIRATRKLSSDGTRPPYYGLMPFGCATDGDIGYIVAFTDAFTFWGLEKAVCLLEAIRYERSGEFRGELETYRRDIDHAIRHMTRTDGYIERKIMTDKAKICTKFENICGAIQFAYTGNIDVNTEVFSRFIAYFENNMMDGFFMGCMDREIVYMGIGEYMWHHAYLRLGEWKKAFAAMRVNFRYGMTQDTFQTQERFSRRNPAFTPWQPNGSGNGRMLDMMLNSLYFEHDGMVTLLGGLPFAWLRKNGRTALKNLFTLNGRVTMTIDKIDEKSCRLTLSADRKQHQPTRLRFPDHFIVTSQNDSTVDCGNGFFEWRENTDSPVFLLSDANI